MSILVGSCKGVLVGMGLITRLISLAYLCKGNCDTLRVWFQFKPESLGISPLMVMGFRPHCSCR